MPIDADEVEQAKVWLDTVEAWLVASAMDQPAPPAELGDFEEEAGRSAVASKFLAVGTPRTMGIVEAHPRARMLVGAQCSYATPRELRIHQTIPAPAELTAQDLTSGRLSLRVATLREACACDIVVVAAPVEIRREWIRNGTLVTVLDLGATLEPALLAAAVVYAIDDAARAAHERRGVRVDATLAAVAAGLVDGRQLDEITVPPPAPPAR